MPDPSTDPLNDPRFSWDAAPQAAPTSDPRFVWDSAPQNDPRFDWGATDKPPTAADVDPAVAEAAMQRMAAARREAGVADESGMLGLAVREYARSQWEQRENKAVGRQVAAAGRGAADALTYGGGGIASVPVAAANQLTKAVTGERSQFLDQVASNITESRRALQTRGPDEGEGIAYAVGRMGVPIIQSLALAPVGGLGAMAALGAAQGAGEGFAVAEDSGATPGQALTAAGVESAINTATNLVPNFGGKAGAALGKQALGVAGRVGIEAAQGGAQQLGVNATRKYVYNPEQELTEGLGQSMAVSGLIRTGFETPGIVRSAGVSIANKRASRIEAEKTANASRLWDSAARAQQDAAREAEVAARQVFNEQTMANAQVPRGPKPAVQGEPAALTPGEMIARDRQRAAQQTRIAAGDVSGDSRGSIVGPAEAGSQMSPEQAARFRRENADRAIGGQQPLSVAEFLSSGAADPQKSVVGPRPDVALSREERARFLRENNDRVVGGQRPLTEAEFREGGTGKQGSTVVGPAPDAPLTDEVAPRVPGLTETAGDQFEMVDGVVTRVENNPAPRAQETPTAPQAEAPIRQAADTQVVEGDDRGAGTQRAGDVGGQRAVEGVGAGLKQSKGHVGFYANPSNPKQQFEVYKTDSGELYRAPINAAIDVDTGRRIGRYEAPANMADERANALLAARQTPSGDPQPAQRVAGETQDTSTPAQAKKLITGEDGTTELASGLPPAMQSALEDDLKSLANDLKGLIGPTPKKWGKAVKSKAQELLLPRGHRPETMRNLNENRLGSISEQAQQSVFAEKDMQRAIDVESGGVRDKAAPIREKVGLVLRGEAEPTTLPEGLRAPVARMREHIDTLTQAMIDAGIGSESIHVTFDQNKGRYVVRTYRQFTDATWAQNVPKDRLDAAAAFFKRENPKWTDDQVASEVRRYLAMGDVRDAFAPTGGKIGSKDLSSLRMRKDIPEPIRRLWGEERDPILNYLQSTAKMARLVANDQFLREVRQDGMGKYLFEPNKQARPEGFDVEIASKDSTTLDHLGGLLTSKEIKKALDEAVTQVQSGPLLKKYMALVGYTKASKTVYSPLSHVRNYGSNFIRLIANGHFGLAKHFAGAHATAITELFGGAPPFLNAAKWRERSLKYKKLGVTGQAVRSHEIQSFFQHASTDGFERPDGKNISRWIKKIGKTSGDLYRLEDDVFNIMNFEAERAQYKKAMPHLSDAELDSLAADITKQNMATQMRVGKGVHMLSRSPLVSDFPTFKAEMLRTTINRMKLIYKEINDPATRAIGVRRAAGMAMASTAGAMAAIYMRHHLGVSKEQMEAARRYVAPWSKNSELIPIHVKDDGTPVLIDLSWLDPFGDMKKPLYALMRGDTPQQAVTGALKEQFGQYFTEGMLTQASREAYESLQDGSGGRAASGERVTNPQKDWEQQTLDVAKHVWKNALEPGAITSARRMKKDPATELRAAVLGRPIDPDPRTGLPFKAGDFSRSSRDATAILSSTARSKDAITPEALAESYDKAEAAHRRLFDELRADVKAAELLGMSRRDIYNLLTSNGVSKADAERVILGVYEPYRPSEQLLRELPRERAVAIAQAYQKKRSNP